MGSWQAVTRAAVFVLCAQAFEARADDQSLAFAAFQSSLTASTSFVSWQGAGGHGFQMVTPIEATTSFKLGSDFNVEAGLKAAQILSSYSSAVASGSVSTVSDTVTHLQVSYEGWRVAQPFLALDLNLPTGSSSLSGSQKNAIMDRDLVFLTRFGEGFNFNPAVGVTIPIGQELIATLAVGYNARGAYIPDADTGSRYAPGNQVIATGGLQYLTKTILLSATAIYTFEQTSHLDGMRYFEPGPMYSLFLRGAYKWNEVQTTSATVFLNHTTKNASIDIATGIFADDSRNSNSDLIIGRVTHDYRFHPEWSVFGAAEFLWRTANLYDETSDFYVPAKTKETLEAGLTHVFTKAISASASLGVFQLQAGSTPFAPSQRYNGLLGRLNVNATF